LEEFVGVAIHGQSPLFTEAAAHAVASMLNKWVIAAKDKVHFSSLSKKP
jgi:hypothetical protein